MNPGELINLLSEFLIEFFSLGVAHTVCSQQEWPVKDSILIYLPLIRSVD